jgi:hypothetical protein
MDVRATQKALNAFTRRYLAYVTPLRVDGEDGPATRRRIRDCKYYLGYVTSRRDSSAGHELLHRLAHPKDPRYLRGTARQRARTITRGMRRRIVQRRRARANHRAAHRKHGVGHYDGVPVANWMVRYLVWARNHGWQGRLVSGWRDPNYSQHLCFVMCSRPSCPGKCAGLSSNHVGSDEPKGAVDVTDYARFGVLMRQCPYAPRIFNALPIDPVHFSASGR